MPTPRNRPLVPFWTTPDPRNARLYHGKTTAVLARLPEKHFHCCVTSTPYWGLRDYGTGTWEGGEQLYRCEYCDQTYRASGLTAGCPTCGETVVPVECDHVKGTRAECPKCGARRADEQIGAEPSPDCDTKGKAQCRGCFVCSLVAVGRAVRRVLRDDGVFWLNLGDTYGSPPGRNDVDRLEAGMAGGHGGGTENAAPRASKATGKSALPAGNLIGVPWRVALALQADGWILRSDVIWYKPSPMPESVRNRCTKAHEYVFQFVKRSAYFYDRHAISQRASDYSLYTNRNGSTVKAGGNNDRGDGGRSNLVAKAQTSNRRSVWSADDVSPLLEWLAVNSPDVLERFLGESGNAPDVWRIASKGYKGAHFACFPPKLPETCIKASTSEAGCCRTCGAPFRRVVEETKLKRDRPNDFVKRTGEPGTGNSTPNSVAGVEAVTTGWEGTCECYSGDPADVAPCRVIDPFVGSGTTGEVCMRLGREFVGVDLNPDYLADHAAVRIGKGLAGG